MQIVPTTTMEAPEQTLTATTKLQTIPKETIQIFKEIEDLDLSSHPHNDDAYV